MEEKNKHTGFDEKMLDAMSMSLFGRHIHDRCGDISAAQKQQLAEACIQRLMFDYTMDREKAEAIFSEETGWLTRQKK